MADTKTTPEQACTAFNQREIDAAPALMTDDVTWPKDSAGGKVIGTSATRPIQSLVLLPHSHIDPDELTREA